MAQTPEQKAAKYLIDACADSRMNEVALAEAIGRQEHAVQARFFNVLVSYVYQMAYWYEVGDMNRGNYQIARLSKKIKDLAFSDEYNVIKYERYGDYEMQNLTLFESV
jgi:hypothetical protein